jgi:hypothetical protein
MLFLQECNRAKRVFLCISTIIYLLFPLRLIMSGEADDLSLCINQTILTKAILVLSTALIVCLVCLRSI